jgi:acyl-coenzyme A synthetase/AMP-(fatty) acid ligase
LWNHEKPSEEITENHITHLSASSTFYRMLSGTFPEVKSVTIGSMRPLENLQYRFPNAKIRNIYATTEHGVIGVSKGDWFPIKENMIVNEYHELLIDGVLTGDLVLVNHDNNTFWIRGRKDQFANVGGEKVSFEYVEQVILANNPQIQKIKVYAKSNSVTGEILLAKVCQVGEEIPDFTGLQKHEIPMCELVYDIETTDNGKIKRR